MICLSDIFLYPIKSCAGQVVSSWPLDLRGLIFDRQWMWVDTSGKFLTQRQFPQMAQVQVKIDSPMSLQMQVQIHQQNFSIPIRTQSLATSSPLKVEIWGESLTAEVLDGPWNSAMSDFLRTPARLVRYGAQEREKPSRFADGETVHFVTRESVDFLRTQGFDVSVETFRPNLVFESSSATPGNPFVEESWDELKFSSGVHLHVSKLCDRCGIINLRPLDGAKAQVLNLKKLADLRQEQTPKKASPGIPFGVHARVQTQGVLSVGEKLIFKK